MSINDSAAWNVAVTFVAFYLKRFEINSIEQRDDRPESILSAWHTEETCLFILAPAPMRERRRQTRSYSPIKYVQWILIKKIYQSIAICLKLSSQLILIQSFIIWMGSHVLATRWDVRCRVCACVSFKANPTLEKITVMLHKRWIIQKPVFLTVVLWKGIVPICL